MTAYKEGATPIVLFRLRLERTALEPRHRAGSTSTLASAYDPAAG